MSLANKIPALPPVEARRDREAQYRLADYKARCEREGAAEGEAAIWEKYEQRCRAIAGITPEHLRELLTVREQTVGELEALLPVPPPAVGRARQ